MREHFCPAENTVIAYQNKCNWCGELESQEPFCYAYKENGEDFFAPKDGYYPADAKPLYTHPPQRTWVGLTNDELTDLFYNTNLGQASAVAQAIALLKEKNT
jgi:hypothetical protein